MENPYKLISELLEDISNQRTQDVIRRRFGLSDGNPQTLQEIGDKYGITRERVRQIEKNGLDYLSQPKIQEKIRPFQDEISDYFKSYGELRREDRIYDDLVCYCFPAKSSLAEAPLSGAANDRHDGKTDKREPALCRAALSLVLTLGKPFEKIQEDEDFYTLWTINKNSLKSAKKAVDSAMKHFDKNQQPLKNAELYSVVKKNIPDISENAVRSYVDASKIIEQNFFGEFGLVFWPEISPRGVRDKAYLILKKEGRPFHFAEVTNLINQQLPQSRPAYIQTVHNELIKDHRFVLIGRGIYALSEWGYAPGTVVDIIKEVLKSGGPMSRDEILKNVLGKRMIKENTVLINLQNKKLFKKLEDGKYAYLGK